MWSKAVTISSYLIQELDRKIHLNRLYTEAYVYLKKKQANPWFKAQEMVNYDDFNFMTHKPFKDVL